MTTIIIHGTFAMQDPWWHAEGAFAQAVGGGLEDAGYADDVWRVQGHPVSTIDVLTRTAGWSAMRGRERLPFETNAGCFHWSGNNTHSDRHSAGQQLGAYVDTLYELGAAEVDVIAHSHGGNVVKEASWHTAFRRVVLLGTPHFVYSDGSGVPYQLNPNNVGRALNVYSTNDTVQVDRARQAPDFLGGPGLPRVGSFAGTLRPVDAQHWDADGHAEHLYDDLELSFDVPRGKKTHAAVRGPAVGRRVAKWLAS